MRCNQDLNFKKTTTEPTNQKKPQKSKKKNLKPTNQKNNKIKNKQKIPHQPNHVFVNVKVSLQV